jgi:hypothetical protein
MALKVDKEFLLKHRFWILLGVFVPFWLFVLIWLSTGVAGEVSKKRGEYAQVDQGLNGINRPPNDTWVEALKVHENSLKGKKDLVWEAVWKPQVDMMTWPGNARSPLNEKLRDKYFGDPIDPADAKEYADNLYREQLREFVNSNLLAYYHLGKRIQYDGKRVVEDDYVNPSAPAFYNGGHYETVIKPVRWGTKDPTTEECWLAQEDIWVKREMLHVIRTAIDTAAHCERASVFKRAELPGLDAKLPEGALAHQVHRNGDWELDLVFALPAAENGEAPALVLSGKSRLKNINADRKTLPLTGLQFRLTRKDARGQVRATAEFQVQGDKLEPDASVELKNDVVLKDFLPRPKKEAADPDRPAAPAPEPDPKVVQDRAREQLLQMTLDLELIADKGSPVPQGYVARQRYRNANWEVDLLLENKEGKLAISGESQVRNINAERRLLNRSGVLFRIQQSDRSGTRREPVWVMVEGEPLAWGEKDPEKMKIKRAVPLPDYDPQQPLEVDQVFNWYTCPIKRLDRIEVGTKEARSHRIANRPMLAKFKKEPAADTTGGGTGGSGGSTSSPAPPGVGGSAGLGPGMMGAGTGGGVGGTQSNPDLTPNGLDAARYTDLSDQVRRMPVAYVLVVDQASVQDVLTACANSRLRMWTTQVHWQHTEKVTPPPQPEGDKTSAKGEGGSSDDSRPRPPGVPPGIGRPGSGSGMGGMGLFGPFNPQGFGGPGGAAGGEGPSIGEQDDPNLVEVAIYNIASLYERYPPKAPAGTEPGK